MADITKNRNYPEGLYQCTFKLLSNDAANQTNMAGNTINRRGLVNTTKSQTMLAYPTYYHHFASVGYVYHLALIEIRTYNISGE